MPVTAPFPGRAAQRAVRLLVLAGAGLPAIACASDLTGVVTSSSLQRPVEGARITLDQSGVQTTSDESGRYILRDLPAGPHTLTIEQPGYAPVTLDVVVPEQGSAVVNGTLSLADGEAVPAGQDIVVTGSRASRVLSIERKRAMATIADVVSSDGIGKLPDYNTAEALQRLPGVSVEIDQGEPRYVVVRGIDPNLNQVTIDGNLVGIPEAEGRRVALDTIPSDLVASIEVVKAVTPDYDANAIGGSINIVTPTAFDQTHPFTSATARGSYNDKSGKTGFGASATHGQKFGAGDQFGVVVAASYSKRFIDSDLAEPTNWATFTTGATTVNAPTTYVLYDYRIMRERIGGIVNLDWRPSDDVRFYLRNIYDQFTDHEERDQFNFALVNGAPAPIVESPTSIRFPNGRATRQFRQNNQTQKLYNVSPGAELKFGKIELDLNYTYAHAQEHTPIRRLNFSMSLRTIHR